MFFIKFFLCFFTFGHLAFSADSSKSQDYFDALLRGEDVKVDCSNILNFTQAYFDLNDKNHILVTTSFDRFMKATSDAQKVSAEMEALKKEVSRTRRLMEDNQLVLSEKAGIIMDVLRDCLKKIVVESPRLREDTRTK